VTEPRFLLYCVKISKAVAGILFYVTFSANFFLYCLTGKRFRTTLFGLCRRSYDSMRLSSSSSSRRSAEAGKLKMETMRQTSANASAVRHRSNYRVAATMRQSSNGTQSAALEMAQFGPNSRSDAVSGTANAREMTATSEVPIEPNHVTNSLSDNHVSAVTCPAANGTSTTGTVEHDDNIGTSCVTGPGTEQVMTSDNGNCITDICSRSVNSSHADNGCVDRDQCSQCEQSQQSDYRSAPIDRQTLLVEETDDFEDPVADCSYAEQTQSECNTDKNSLTSDRYRQRLTSDSLINDSSSDVFEHSDSFSSGSRIVGKASVENDTRWVVGQHTKLPRRRSSSFPGLSCDFDLPKHLAKCKMLRYRMYSLLT
jgi:hypothetical protein